MDKSIEEIDADFKTLENLSVAQGQIRLRPSAKTNIRAFVQWTRDELRLQRNPTSTEFPMNEARHLIRRYKTHEHFIKNAKNKDTAKPEKFTKETKWADFRNSLQNYLRVIPGRDGVPLSYVIRRNDNPDPTPDPDFLDDYVAMARLAGPAFDIDKADVHTIIIN